MEELELGDLKRIQAWFELANSRTELSKGDTELIERINEVVEYWGC